MVAHPASDPTRKVAIALSREELYMVMRLIRASEIPGFDLTWIKLAADGSLSTQTRDALTVATNALIARGYLAPSNVDSDPEHKQTLLMPSPVIALVGACAFADYTLFLALRSEGKYHLVYLHEYRNVTVAHTIVSPDVHLFEAINGRQGVLAIIDAMLGLQTQNTYPAAEGNVLMVRIQAARDAAMEGNLKEAERLLVSDNGLPFQTAQVFSQTLYQASTLGSLTIVSHDAAGERQQDSIALVVSPETCFMLSDGGSRPATFHVQSVSAADIRKWIITRLRGQHI